MCDNHRTEQTGNTTHSKLLADMTYQFDTEYAEKYGVDEAILIQNFVFWIAKNKANGKHQHEGRTWTYNSYKAFTDLFPFWSEHQIRTRIDSLVEQGVIIKGNFNKNSYDHTTWYALKDQESFMQDSQIELVELPDRSGKATDSSINTDNKPYKKDIPPTKSDVIDWLMESKSLSKSAATKIADDFIDFYASKNWMVGKNKMTSWQHALGRACKWDHNKDIIEADKNNYQPQIV